MVPVPQSGDILRVANIRRSRNPGFIAVSTYIPATSTYQFKEHIALFVRGQKSRISESRSELCPEWALERRSSD